MAKVAEHVKNKHNVQTTTDTIANFVKLKVKRT